MKQRKKERGYYDFSLLAIIILLISFGLVMLYSTSAYTAELNYHDDMYFFKRQSIISAFCVFMAVGISMIDYHILERFATILYISALGLMILVQTGLGYESHGARRWIQIGSLTLQPAEIAKVAVIVTLSVAIVHMGRSIRTPKGLGFLALLGGAFVNPVQAGLDCVKELTPVRAIQALAEKDGTEEVWLAEDAWPWTNLPLLAGQKTAGCTQPYPDPEYWRAADPEGIYTEAYNRFCNISVSLTETEPTVFSNPAEDQLEVRLNLSDLKKLGVTRLMTRREWPERAGGCAFELLDTEGEFRFYAVSWEE
jgi:hypothetical protein